jgi:hypothetical protein
MTSTVLDVGLFLLCVSASIVTVSGVDPAGDGGGYHADDLADRIATETVTIEYEMDDGGRRRHATLAEHLVTAATIETDGGEGIGGVSRAGGVGRANTGSNEYVDAVHGTIEPRLDPGTAVVVRLPVDAGGDDPDETRSTDTEGETERRRTVLSIGGSPPKTARVRTSVVQVPVGDEWRSAGAESSGGNTETARIVVRRWDDGPS